MAPNERTRWMATTSGPNRGGNLWRAELGGSKAGRLNGEKVAKRLVSLPGDGDHECVKPQRWSPFDRVRRQCQLQSWTGGGACGGRIAALALSVLC